MIRWEGVKALSLFVCLNPILKVNEDRAPGSRVDRGKRKEQQGGLWVEKWLFVWKEIEIEGSRI